MREVIRQHCYNRALNAAMAWEKLENLRTNIRASRSRLLGLLIEGEVASGELQAYSFS